MSNRARTIITAILMVVGSVTLLVNVYLLVRHPGRVSPAEIRIMISGIYFIALAWLMWNHHRLSPRAKTIWETMMIFTFGVIRLIYTLTAAYPEQLERILDMIIAIFVILLAPFYPRLKRWVNALDSTHGRTPHS